VIKHSAIKPAVDCYRICHVLPDCGTNSLDVLSRTANYY